MQQDMSIAKSVLLPTSSRAKMQFIHIVQLVAPHLTSVSAFYLQCIVEISLPIYSPSATPDWRYVPKKYHEFMIPSVRRVYIEIPSQTGLKNQIALLESRVKSLEKDKLLLMSKCESNMAASTTHAEGEKKARLDVEKAKKEMMDVKRKYDTLKGKYNDLKTRLVSALVDFYNFFSWTYRDTGEQNFSSQSTMQPLEAEESPVHSQPKRSLTSCPKRSLQPDDDLVVPTNRKRSRRSAPEVLENAPPREYPHDEVIARQPSPPLIVLNRSQRRRRTDLSY
jgi:hypothetical protein